MGSSSGRVAAATFLLMNSVIFICSCFLGCEEGPHRTSAQSLLQNKVEISLECVSAHRSGAGEETWTFL